MSEILIKILKKTLGGDIEMKPGAPCGLNRIPS